MSDTSESRRMQRRRDLPHYATDELEGLKTLTQNQCTSSPRLVNHMQCEQDETMWIPGGYLLFILMTRCPGISVEKFDRKLLKRDEILPAFEDAYRYVSFVCN